LARGRIFEVFQVAGKQEDVKMVLKMCVREVYGRIKRKKNIALSSKLAYW
jgi:hypothetical protein